MSVKKCNICGGSGKVSPLGNILRECEPCSGIGWLDDPEKENDNDDKNEVKSKHQRRKAKSHNENN